MSHHDQTDKAKTDHPKITRGAEDVADQESEAGRHDWARTRRQADPPAARRRAT